MPTVNVKHNMQEILNGVRQDRESIPKAASRALNTAIRGLKTDAGREIRKRYPRLKLKDVSSLMDLSFANESNLVAVLAVKGRPLSLMRFKVGVITDRGRGGVWVDVKGQRKFIPHAWVQVLKNKQGDDYQVIFIRDGKGRFPVKVLKTIDVPSALNIKEVVAVLDDLVEARFDKEFIRQLVALAK